NGCSDDSARPRTEARRIRGHRSRADVDGRRPDQGGAGFSAGELAGVRSARHMTLLPRHAITRRIAAVWLLACFAILVVMLLHPGINADSKSPLKILVPLYFLSFPIGHAAVMGCIEIKLTLYLKGEPQPGIFLEGLFLWISMTVLGYAQW